MKKAKMELHKIFNWNYNEFFKAVFGTFLFCFAINIFIVPHSLYNGGVLGISQLIRTLVNSLLDINPSFDYSGIINLVINIPLFIIAYKGISKAFFSRTLLCVIIQTIFLSVVPVPADPLVKDLLTSCLIGGMLAGLGGGMLLSSGSSGGGTDIVGIVVATRNRNFTVGKLGLAINVVIYTICGILYGLETMIYSVIYTVFTTLMVDNTHDQNICSTAVIFTKSKPVKILNYIKNELDRDGTYWKGVGGYDASTTYILYAVLSKYELQRLERHLNELDKDAFIVKSDGVGIKGKFKKNFS